jgi:hypothetical protein
MPTKRDETDPFHTASQFFVRNVKSPEPPG